MVGSRLVPLLVGRGHFVVGTTRSPAKLERLRAAGAESCALDALDREAVMAAVAAARPDVVVHELTDLTAMASPRAFVRAFATTNRLRTEGIDNLLAAGRAAGVGRFVAQGFAGWPYARDGGPVKEECDPLDPGPPVALAPALAALRHLEAAVRAAGGMVLRYGNLYGPGTSLGPNGVYVRQVRAGRLPVIGAGTGVWSFLHADDAAAATVLAIEGGPAGVYNVVDDDPAPVAEWLPALAAAVGGPPPRRVPAWLARLAIGETGVVLMTEVRGASNAKARRELRWRPAHASWRTGFIAMTGAR